MQGIFNTLVVVNSIILGVGIYLISTAKPARKPRETNPAQTKDPVKAAFQFEITPAPKKRGRPLGSKNKKTKRSKGKKAS